MNPRAVLRAAVIGANRARLPPALTSQIVACSGQVAPRGPPTGGTAEEAATRRTGNGRVEYHPVHGVRCRSVPR
jgi:hypothetical protein